MSLIVTVHTNEGIVMASDSRTTYTTTNTKPDNTIERLVGVQITDTTYKTFLCQDRIGISTCGAGDINGIPISGYIEDYIKVKTNEDSTVESVAQGLIDYFRAFSPIPNTHFIVAGYNLEDSSQHIVRAYVVSNKIANIDTSKQGVVWDGEIDIFQRLVMMVGLKNQDGSYTDLENYEIGYNFFTLQDAINFAEYALDVTIKTMFFQLRVKTVGGPIDILAIKPAGAFWIKQKELHA